MKLLRIFPTLDLSSGGPVAGALNSSVCLSQFGVTTTLATLDPPGSPWFDSYNVPINALGPTLGKYSYRRSLPAAIRSLASQHDCVIVEGLWQYHSFATWRALHSTSIPYYVYTHGMLDPWFRHTYPLKHIKKSLYWPLADYAVLRDATCVLFTTENERLRAHRSFWPYKAIEKVVGYGISPPSPDVEAQTSAFFNLFPHLRNKKILLFVGRIDPVKGIDMLIEAFAAVSIYDQRLELVIVGPDTIGLQTSLCQRSRELGVSHRITWTGMLTGLPKWGAFRSAELFCLPSHSESFGVVVAEALSCGLPVAIANTVMTSSEVSEYHAGFVYVDDVSGITSALKSWLEFPMHLKQRMSQRALQLFNDKFDISSVVHNLLHTILPSV